MGGNSSTPADRRDRRIAAVVVLLALGFAGTGIPRLVEDGPAAYELPAEHPLQRLNERFVAATGGDDVLGVLLVSQGSLVSPAGVDAMEKTRLALVASGVFEGVRDFTTMSLLTTRDGTVTGESPLDRRPPNVAGWSSVEERLTGDPFVAGLLSKDATTALVVGWIRRDSADSRYVSRVEQDLADTAFRATAAGKALRSLVDQVRVDVMMGDRPGPPDVAVAAALAKTRDGKGAAASYLAGVWARAEAQAADPVAAAEAVIEAALGEAGEIRRLPVGAPFVEKAVAARYPEHLALGFLGVFAALPVLVAGRRESWKIALTAMAAAGVALAGAVGVFGWFGLPLHPISAGFVLGVGLLTSLGLLGAGSLRQPRLELLLLLLLPWCSRDLHGVSGLGLSAALAVAWGVVWTAGRTVPTQKEGSLDPELLGLTRRPSTAAMGVAAAIVALGAFAAAAAPLGIRPATWLSPADPVGDAMAAMDAKLGGSTPIHVVSAASEGGLAEPKRLAAMRDAQASIAADPGVDSVVGWTDFLQQIHAAVSGEAGVLPERVDLVQQYLLMFDRPKETRPLVAPDKSMGVAFVRMKPGEGGRLASLVEAMPAGTGGPAIAGQAAALALGGLYATRSLAVLLALGFVVALGALLWVPVAGSGRAVTFDARLSGLLTAVHVSAPSGILAIGAAAFVGQSLGPEALLAGALVAGTSLAVSRCDERDRLQAFVLLGLGLGVLVLGSVAPLRGLGVGAVAGSIAALGLGRTAA